MAIPRIEPYEIPAPVTAERATWLPDADRCALLVHDMQEYFLAAYQRDAEPARTAVANIARLIDHARSAGIPVVYTCQPGDQHSHRRGLLSELWGAGMATGPDTEVIAELAPTPRDIVVTKWRYSAFERTDLRDLLARAGRDQLLVTGVYAHLGCQVSAVDAFMADVEPIAVSDAQADFSAEDHASALRWVARSCGRVLTTDVVLDHLCRTTSTVPDGRQERVGAREKTQMTWA